MLDRAMHGLSSEAQEASSDPSPGAHVLVLSDDRQFRALLCELLLAHRYRVAADDCTRRHCFGDKQAGYDLVIVDLTGVRPGSGPIRLREAQDVPIIAVSDQPNDSTPSIRADVALQKPFDPRELLLVIRGLLHQQRQPAGQEHDRLCVGPLAVEPLMNAATVDSREIQLTGVEARVLGELMRNPGQVVPRNRLVRLGLGRSFSPLDRSLDTHINRLRKKVGADRRGRSPIRTVRGVGYLLVSDWRPADPGPM